MYIGFTGGPRDCFESGTLLIGGAIACGNTFGNHEWIFDTNCFQLQHYQAINTDVIDCQHRHRSSEGMEHIGDNCPYCGKEIESKVGDIPNDSN